MCFLRSVFQKIRRHLVSVSVCRLRELIFRLFEQSLLYVCRGSAQRVDLRYLKREVFLPSIASENFRITGPAEGAIAFAVDVPSTEDGAPAHMLSGSLSTELLLLKMNTCFMCFLCNLRRFILNIVFLRINRTALHIFLKDRLQIHTKVWNARLLSCSDQWAAESRSQYSGLLLPLLRPQSRTTFVDTSWALCVPGA